MNKSKEINSKNKEQQQTASSVTRNSNHHGKSENSVSKMILMTNKEASIVKCLSVSSNHWLLPAVNSNPTQLTEGIYNQKMTNKSIKYNQRPESLKGAYTWTYITESNSLLTSCKCRHLSV